MRRRINKIIRLLFSMDNAERDVTVLPDDIFIVSYPKSGNTWLRFLVANIVFPDREINLSNIESTIPDI